MHIDGTSVAIDKTAFENLNRIVKELFKTDRTVIPGDLEIQGNLIVNGVIPGDLKIQGNLIVGGHASVLKQMMVMDTFYCQNIITLISYNSGDQYVNNMNVLHGYTAGYFAANYNTEDYTTQQAQDELQDLITQYSEAHLDEIWGHWDWENIALWGEAPSS